MAYSYETSSVKTINGEVSGLADVVARQAIANLPTLSAGEGIALVTENGKTRIENNISAGTNISLVLDEETNKIRIDSEGGGAIYSGIAPIVVNNATNQISADTWSFSAGDGLIFTDDNVNKVTKLEVEGEELSAGPNIDIFSSGGYVVISANGGNTFPITGTDGTANFTANANCSSFTLTTAQGAAGCYVNLDAKNVLYEAYPSTTISASWYDILNKANEASSNCYCFKYDDTHTAVNLSSLSAYDKVTIVNARDYGQDCLLHWDGKTKEIPSGLYIEMIKGTFNSKEEWYFASSGWLNQNWWDYD